MHPDFVFFNEVDGEVDASIVDPHGHHLEDSLVKLQALARFAEGLRRGVPPDRGAQQDRTATMRVLDLQDEAVRSAVLESSDSPENLYRRFGSDYAL